MSTRNYELLFQGCRKSLYYNNVATEVTALADTAILEFEEAVQRMRWNGLKGLPKIGQKRNNLVKILQESVNPYLAHCGFSQVETTDEHKLRTFCRTYILSFLDIGVLGQTFKDRNWKAQNLVQVINEQRAYWV